jgi:hypothetical protein
MSENAMEETELKNIWKKAGEMESPAEKYSIEEIQLYRVKKSKQAYRKGKAGILFDIIYKAVALFEYIFLLISLNNQFPYQQIITALTTAVIILIAADMIFLKKLSLVKYSGSVLENLHERFSYLKTTYFKFIFINALSGPLFITGGFFIYFYFRYNAIQMAGPFEDPVLYLLIIVAFCIPFAAQYIDYKNQYRELKESIEDLDDGGNVSEKIAEAEKRSKKIILISSVLIITGILIFLIILFILIKPG